MFFLPLKNNCGRQTGFSLLELILAVAIFSLGSVALATLIIDANLSTKVSTERTEALFYAKEGIEAVRSIRDDDWANLEGNSYGLDSSSGHWELTNSPDLIDDKYTRSITIEADNALERIVTVDIDWELSSSRSVKVRLVTWLTHWR